MTLANKTNSGQGNWVTINGVHVLIGANGKIIKGPAKFIGSTVDDLKNQKMTDDKKAQLKAKYGDKTSTSDKKETTKKENTEDTKKDSPKKEDTKKDDSNKEVDKEIEEKRDSYNSLVSKISKEGYSTNDSSDFTKQELEELKKDDYEEFYALTQGYGYSVGTTVQTVYANEVYSKFSEKAGDKLLSEAISKGYDKEMGVSNERVNRPKEAYKGFEHPYQVVSTAITEWTKQGLESIRDSYNGFKDSSTLPKYRNYYSFLGRVIESAIESSPKNSTPLYRGLKVNDSNSFLTKLKVGDKLDMEGKCSSWSSESSIAKEYAGKNGVVLSIKKGKVKALDVNTDSQYLEDMEKIISGKVTPKVASVTNKDGNILIELEVQ